MKKILIQIAPLIIVDALLLSSTHAWASMQSVALSSPEIGATVMLFPFMFLATLGAASLIESIWRAREFVDDATGQVNLRALWHSTILSRNPITAVAVSVLMGYGIIACANLAEIYRTTATRWHDDSLWNIEAPLFSALLGSWLDVPAVWDRIYFLIWPFLFIAMALIFKAGRQRIIVQIALAVVIAFYLTRCINLLLPTAGPAFYRTELFSLAGTISERAQEGLRLYMDGRIPQNGLIPGTMAMPSLHVGLTAIAVWFLAREWRWTLCLTIPWLLLIWLSTIMLGWHYALDGIGGIFVVWIAALAARSILHAWHALLPMNEPEDKIYCRVRYRRPIDES